MSSMEILLGNAQHSIYSDELWYMLIVADEVTLEARFQSDAPHRTGWPAWIHTEFCISKDEESAVCRVTYDNSAHLRSVSRLSFVPGDVWAKAVDVCQRLDTGQAP